MGAPAALRDDATLVSHAVTELARRTHFPVAFGGLEHDGAVHVSTVVGARTRSIEGLVVHAERGLGGRALVERRPRLALDYRTARTITHDYDRAILGEGIATLFAVPVLVRGSARGVLYCGSWAQAPLGDREARPAFDIAGELGTELRVRDEVDRRLAAATPGDDGLSAGAREEIRQSYAQLRSIAAIVDDDHVRRRLEELESRLAALSGDAAVAPEEAGIHLSRRELDVLSCAAVGATNGEIAASLALRETTVKSYLASAMSKLDASTRHAAVARARRVGLLP
ncbi:MAG: helix-turn-helix transcriptional regulator [Microbacterium sp. SCN 71-17]|uniref:response regulator transcription factor n=1 Tax=unclassified Microbacterium TaxID=2609290 RepID=UPI0008698DBB|nr:MULTISPECIES: LuxR C-terminal-related transcriptional regulator [unclassified Microbacterium]ODT41609.1 MAG: helix-turn-helix transcriptional regulator [Microbacterium sp. SCN 71-17]SIS09312.1 regulatory protein, luxR family [Microbacterium sp. RURRCA19A]